MQEEKKEFQTYPRWIGIFDSCNTIIISDYADGLQYAFAEIHSYFIRWQLISSKLDPTRSRFLIFRINANVNTVNSVYTLKFENHFFFHRYMYWLIEKFFYGTLYTIGIVWVEINKQIKKILQNGHMIWFVLHIVCTVVIYGFSKSFQN